MRGVCVLHHQASEVNAAFDQRGNGMESRGNGVYIGGGALAVIVIVPLLILIL